MANTSALSTKDKGKLETHIPSHFERSFRSEPKRPYNEGPQRQWEIQQNRQCSQTKKNLFQIDFLLTIGLLFQESETLFQKKEPLIHVLFAESVELLKNFWCLSWSLQRCLGRVHQSLPISAETTWTSASQTEIDVGQDVKDWLQKLENWRQKIYSNGN